MGHGNSVRLGSWKACPVRSLRGVQKRYLSETHLSGERLLPCSSDTAWQFCIATGTPDHASIASQLADLAVCVARFEALHLCVHLEISQYRHFSYLHGTADGSRDSPSPPRQPNTSESSPATGPSRSIAGSNRDYSQRFPPPCPRLPLSYQSPSILA